MTVEQSWFEMAEIRRKRIANTVWIPLRQAETARIAGTKGEPGYQEEVVCAGSVAFPPENRELAERLGWTDIGVASHPTPYAFKDGRYKPADVYQYYDGEDTGIHLIVGTRAWEVNQDLVLALELVKEGDSWVRPSEGYVEVMRQRVRDGDVKAIEIKAEFLRDYLAARGLALRIATYRERTAILDDASHLPNWHENPIDEQGQHEHFATTSVEVDKNGWPVGKVAVMRVWRTDVDASDDVPVMGPETDENTAHSHDVFERGGNLTRVSGRLWREEWLEAANKSERVRGDETDEQIYFAVDADGGRLPAKEMNDEDVGRWLWFRPNVIPELISRRDGELSWYSNETGSVQCSDSWGTHFGVNVTGLINVYAYDIAKLPLWQQRIWSGHNVAPEGSVSAELLASQVNADPADTTAPELRFLKLREALNALTKTWCGSPLFKAHDSETEIMRSIHRFRALDHAGLLSLAKDIARLTADSIDVGTLAAVIKPPKDQKWRSLKHLEQALASISDTELARRALRHLVGAYELRLGDAHLPTSKIAEAFELVKVERSAPPLQQGVQLISSTAESLWFICAIIDRHLQKSNDKAAPTDH